MSRKISKRKMLEEVKVLREKMARLERQFDVGGYNSPQQPSESSESESEESEYNDNSIITQAQVHTKPSTPHEVDHHHPQTNDQISQGQLNTEDQQVFSTFLGDKPNSLQKTGDAFHEEIVLRWISYLREGVSQDTRKELKDKYLIPENCLALNPPQLNEELKSLIPEHVQKREKFLIAIQDQLAIGLTALGGILDQKIKEPTSEINLTNENVQKLAESAQIIANVHYALSIHRRTNIIPYMNTESKSASLQCPIDDWLFGTGFMEKIKSCQTINKACQDIRVIVPKKDKVQATNKKNYLNSRRTQSKYRMKKEEGKVVKTTGGQKDASRLMEYRQPAKYYNYRRNPRQQ